MRLHKLFNVILFVVIGLILSACYPQDKLVFNDGFYYQNESIQFTDSINIEEIKLDFKTITNIDYEERNAINVLKNHKNDFTYEVIFSLRFNSELELKKYDFEYFGKVYSDTYKIVLNITNYDLDIQGTITLRLDFLSLIGNTESTKNIAGRLYIAVVESKLKSLNQNKIEIISFPNNLEYVKKGGNNET